MLVMLACMQASHKQAHHKGSNACARTETGRDVHCRRWGTCTRMHALADMYAGSKGISAMERDKAGCV